MTFDIISTGSTGNAVLLNDHILIDCGVPLSKLRPHIKQLRLVLLTHIHGDHFKPSTVRALHRERPTLRFCCCQWMVPHLMDAGVRPDAIDLFASVGSPFYRYADGTRIRPDALVHDVPNCCWHISCAEEMAFYATDTGTLDHISAPGYDLYLIEANHTEADIEARRAEKEAAGQPSYEWRAAASHLSQEQALEWLAQNAGPNSKYIFLHQHVDKEAPNV